MKWLHEDISVILIRGSQTSLPYSLFQLVRTPTEAQDKIISRIKWCNDRAIASFNMSKINKRLFFQSPAISLLFPKSESRYPDPGR